MGHIAIGYISGKVSSKLLKTNVNIPLALTLSVLPDIDIFFQHFQFLQHRGPLHSIIVMFLVFIPVFAVYRKSAVPYFVALVQHSLIGDYIIGGQLRSRGIEHGGNMPKKERDDDSPEIAELKKLLPLHDQIDEALEKLIKVDDTLRKQPLVVAQNFIRRSVAQINDYIEDWEQ